MKDPTAIAAEATIAWAPWLPHAITAYRDPVVVPLVYTPIFYPAVIAELTTTAPAAVPFGIHTKSVVLSGTIIVADDDTW